MGWTLHIAALISSSLLVACGFDPTGSDAPADAGTNDGAPLVDAGGDDLRENISLPPGWTAEVFYDFSQFHDFDPASFEEENLVFSNRPHRLVLFDAPFEPGLGLVTSSELIEARPPTTYIRHDYFRATASGPDVIWDAEPCVEPALLTKGICLGATSPGGGDGVFLISESFSISQISNKNNVVEVVSDPGGIFDGSETAQLYVGGPDGLARLDEPALVSGDISGGFVTLQSDGDILAVVGTTTRSLQQIKRETVNPIPLASVPIANANVIAPQNQGAIAIVTGGDVQFPDISHIIVSAKSLSAVGPNGSITLVAQTDSADDWLWTHALIPPVDHPLGDPNGVFYLLEVNPTLGIDRILKLSVNDG